MIACISGKGRECMDTRNTQFFSLDKLGDFLIIFINRANLFRKTQQRGSNVEWWFEVSEFRCCSPTKPPMTVVDM